ncbi:prolipoprotein diacylglyceryl transferase [Coxiella endosymbiont of Ornithodoros maritimus]|uniref:prolipoprotein diacylglyceryl transferase n=1 Tax=Coxiella endosymbiont of Ornithodoros maritimus TaxID=1656172 RepID=UPI00226511C6|nr:prolipoprotein diacylglyceryl transferase [Coxiella endosymbiont of Ornithodoros maritimus]
MLYYPHIDPMAFRLGPLKVHWYGLMYLVGFAMAWGLALYRARDPKRHWTAQQVGDLIFYGALGLIIGGRLGYMLFYDFSNFIANPLVLFQVWRGGMSFHGGLIGVIITTWIFSRRTYKRWMDVTDFLVPLVPLGLSAGRIGNFINGELWGRVTTVPWGMVFPNAGPLPRHPSQLYEFLLEGMLLFIVIWWFSAKLRPRFAVSSLFLLCYGLFRFTVEFFRQPDPQLGFVALGWLTKGQELSLPMIIIGGFALWWAYQHKKR